MEAVVLAGGLGTRLRGVVPDIPKVMAPIAGAPFLSLVLRRLSASGFRRVILSVGHRHEAIASYFGARYEGLNLSYEIENEPLGTGGGLRAAFSRIKGDYALVLNGDTFLNLNFGAVEAQYHINRMPIIVVRYVSSTNRYGRVEVHGNRVVGIARSDEHSPGLINAGYYVLPKNVFDDSPARGVFSFEDVFLPTSIAKRNYGFFVSDDFFVDIGVPEDYRRAADELPHILGF